MMSKDEAWLLKEKYGDVPSEAFTNDCRRLAAGEPLAYVIGCIPFLDTTIWLDSHPLIPRVETEYWVHECHTEIAKTRLDKITILDLCAGSGAIGVATLHRFPNAYADFAELDPLHLPTIQKNLDHNGIDRARYTIFIGDLFTPIPKEKRYDIIMSNPPYINRSLKRTDPSVIDHEPSLALFSDEAGTAHLCRIIDAAPAHLTAGGELWLEHEPEHTPFIKTLAKGFQVTTYCDQYALERYSRLVLQ
jgi:HemK-like putative methylase